MSGKRKIDRTEPHPRIVYTVTWNLKISIEFSEGAFDDCYGSERQEQEDIYRESEVCTRGSSSNAYGDLSKANKAATERFEILAKKYLKDYKVISETENDSGAEDEDNDEDANIVTLTHDNAGCKSWKWFFDTHDGYENDLFYRGSVSLTPIRIMEHDGVVYKEYDMDIL
mmetsp:Transcript_11918/g.13630  ORF Transcript_11918/g.13630 Transcript_11918/m.13630 type:complete len:170 (+) Transcript_11918:112-621(+)